MTKVTSVPVAKLKTYGEWKRAPVGALLQARDTTDNATLVGLRCEMKISGGFLYPCFLVLDGEKRGALLDEGAIRDSVLDVSSLLEIRVNELSPIAYSEAHYKLYGIVCEFQAGSGHFLVRAKTREDKRVFVWLSDPSGNEPMGRVESEAIPNLLVVGLTEVSEILPPHT